MGKVHTHLFVESINTTQDSKHVRGTLSGGQSMSYQIIPIDFAHGDSHLSLYEGNHQDYHFSFLPLGVPVPLFIVSNGDPLRDSISSFKALYILWGVYQVSKSTHLSEIVKGERKVKGNQGGRGRKGSKTKRDGGKTENTRDDLQKGRKALRTSS